MYRIRIAIYLILLAAAIAQRFWLLIIFQLALGLLWLYLYKFPDSRLVPLLGYWFGPKPRLGERRSSYLFRLATFSFTSFVILVGLMFLGYNLFSYLLSPKAADNHQVLIGIFAFGLPLFAGAAALASLGCAIKAMWLRLTGNDPLFVPSLNELDQDHI